MFQSKVVKNIVADTGNIELYDNGIISHTPFSHIKKTSIDILKNDFNYFLELANHKKALLFYDATSLNDFTSEEKKFM